MKTKSLVFVSISVVATVLGSIAARDAAADNRPFTPVNVSPVVGCTVPEPRLCAANTRPLPGLSV